jgi:hypothetical protein
MNAINPRQVLDRLDEERRTLARDGEVREVLGDVTRLHAAAGSHHCVIFSALSPATADAAIAREIDHYRRLGVGFEWKVYAHDAPTDLVDRLRRQGFAVGAEEAVLFYDLSNPPPWAREADTGAVRRIDQAEQVDDYRAVAEDVFGKDYAFTTAELLAALRSWSTQHRGYVAYDGDKAVSIGRLYTHPKSHFGGLYGGGTLATHRGRGFYRAVVAARARDAVAAGAKYLIVDALLTSRPVLERMGFVMVTRTWPCEWSP